MKANFDPRLYGFIGTAILLALVLLLEYCMKKFIDYWIRRQINKSKYPKS